MIYAPDCSDHKMISEYTNVIVLCNYSSKFNKENNIKYMYNTKVKVRLLAIFLILQNFYFYF